MTAVGKPGVPRARVQKQIDEDPSVCERPKFHLGPARKTPEMDTIWVVNVPRRPFKIEKERLPPEELAARPPVPRLAVGDYVVVTGTWTLRSPHNAVAARPDAAMYQLFLGRMTYEARIARARAELAAAQGKQPDQVVPDLGAVDFTDAMRPLLAAVKLEPRLWGAHYHIGRIYRDNGHWNEAAGEFTAAVRLGAPDPGPYVALCELYRRWGVRDLALAIAIATLGTQHVIRSAVVWFELGMAHDDLRHDADAIAAFTRALAIDPDHALAKFQRGQAYLRTKAKAKARADLEDFVAHPPPGEEFAVAQANKMLLELH